MTPTERAQAAYTRAEIEKDPRIKAAWRAAAATWERIAGPGQEWSHKRLECDLADLKRDAALGIIPVEPPRAPKAAPMVDKPDRRSYNLRIFAEAATIQF
jgi:hypothetical protein